jgi:hypothetical protein
LWADKPTNLHDFGYCRFHFSIVYVLEVPDVYTFTKLKKAKKSAAL